MRAVWEIKRSTAALLALLGGALLLAPPAASAQSLVLDNSSDYFLDSPDKNKYAVILTGPAAGEENRSRFRQWSFSLHDILIRDYGYQSETIELVYDQGPEQSGADSRVDWACNADGIRSSLSQLAARVAPGDQITLFFIGHGSGADEEAKFNIVGPDLTGPEFAELLDPFDQQDMVIVNTTSASYGFSSALSAEGRVVISSTRSPSERFDPIFSRYFIEALDARRGDRDKNSRVSMLEAFNYARASVEGWYEEQGRLAAEHAGLDDNGDALFALEPGSQEADGRLAEIAFIDALKEDVDGLTAQAVTLKARMQELERSIFILRGRKAEFLEEDYWQQLEALLVELAQVTGEFDAATTP
jgi:hypothetical protein